MHHRFNVAPRMVWSALLLALVLVGALLALSPLLGGKGSDGVEAQGQPPEQKVIFVAGLFSSFSCQDLTDPNALSIESRDWATLWSSLKAQLPEFALGEDDVFMFSYSGDYNCPGATPLSRANYAPIDTCASIDGSSGGEGQAQRFDAWFQQLRQQYPNATWDIFGHSLGGLVVSYWASTADDASLAAVHSIVLMSSPLQGSSIVELITQLGNGEFSCFDNTSSVLDISSRSNVISALNLPSGPVMCLLESDPAAVTARVPVLTVRNVRDIIVPVTTSCLPGAADLVFFDNCEISGHLCVLSNPDVAASIADWMREGEAAVRADPGPSGRDRDALSGLVERVVRAIIDFIDDSADFDDGPQRTSDLL